MKDHHYHGSDMTDVRINRAVIVLLCFLVLSFGAFVTDSNALPKKKKPVVAELEQKVKVIEGIIENMSHSDFLVRGVYYSFFGVPVTDPSGSRVMLINLRIGDRVSIYFQEGKITSVLVYERNSLD